MTTSGAYDYPAVLTKQSQNGTYLHRHRMAGARDRCYVRIWLMSGLTSKQTSRPGSGAALADARTDEGRKRRDRQDTAASAAHCQAARRLIKRMFSLSTICRARLCPAQAPPLPPSAVRQRPLVDKRR